MENNIKFLRRSQEFDISQEELAYAVGVTRQRIIQVESGEIPSAVLMLKISYFFNKDPREIWSGNLVVSTLRELRDKRTLKLNVE
ncbi:helix-turn-helix domain-containing protein [Brevibacillus nitrificans]|uniref:helix-turn-helix transcriptional regulator n=1 Tax=Brevibacillus nitrificans TaxID=651560 RepID=UPI00286AC427|nr:helix-turn-helix domain-containing protein [Brevibacillus nitrificans]